MRRRLRAVALAAAAGALAASACAERTPPADEPLIDTAGIEGGAAAPADRAAAGAPATGPVEPKREGQVSRAALDAVLDAGPGRFLASIEIRARVVKGRFSGWRVVRAPWPEVDLRAGDVVREVNGRTLEHPLELKLLWDELRRATAIAAEVERSGERFSLRFAVVPAPVGAAP